MDLKLQDLQFYLIPGENVGLKDLQVYNEAYRMWKNVWSETLRELDGNGAIYADDFSRQTLHGALFNKSECIAMTAFHFVDFNTQTGPEDSYFKAWTPEALKTLTREGPEVLICSHLTIAKDWRGALASNLSLKLLICDLSIRYFLETGFPVMTGTMRCNRGAHKSAYDVGGTPIMKNAMMHGVEVDLVGFYRREILENPELQKNIWTQTLWNRHIDISKQQLGVQPRRRIG